MKPYRFLLLLSLLLLPGRAFTQCTTPVVNSFTDIFYNSVRVHYTCCMTGNYFLEYGYSGFTPGIGATAGTGGTLVAASASPGEQVISGLNFSQVYDVYVRVECSGGGWTSNSAVKRFRPGVPCTTAQTISCGTDYQVVIPSGFGAWNNILCAPPQTTKGREKMYKYTATVTGNHQFYVGVSSGSSNRVSFRYRIDSLPCNENNWICITSAPTISPVTVQIGTLIAGKTYYFLADAASDTIVPDTASFRIECPPITCPPPTNFSVTSPAVGQIQLDFTGSNCQFEFGPVGFTPGTTFFPGTGGTLLSATAGYPFSGFGLQPGNLYHGYLRTYCTFGGNTYFSQNVGPRWFQVRPCDALWIYDPLTGPLSLLLNNSWTGGAAGNYHGACYNSFSGGVGDDVRFQFVCTKTGSYKAILDVSPYNNLEMGMKVLSSACLPNNYDCISISNGTGNNPATASLGVLLKDSVYDFLIDTWDTTETYLDFSIECEGPNNITVANTGPFGFDLNWSCNCADTVFAEIGPEGFTPGTGYAAGTGGTIVYAFGTSHTFSNLQTFTKYDVYLRTSCGTFFSANKKISVFTPKDCSQAPAVTCGDNINHYFNSTLWYYPTGPWNVQSCNGGNLGAEEYIYRFTPAVSGMHKIQIYGLTSNWTGYAFTAKYFYKHDSLGCNADNWNCIGQVVSTLPAFTQQEFLFGPLTAGETYYIMIDGVNWTYRWHTFYARLLCPGTCTGPSVTGVAPVHPNGAVVYASCNFCAPNTMLEIGPQGFTPGTGTQAGPNGTLYQNVTFPYTLSGLTTGDTYDIYVRSDCSLDTTGFTTGISSNSGPVTVTPCSVIPAPITYSTGSNIICQGQSITLYRNGGVAAPGAVYRWYENGCGSGNFIGTGDSITVSPTNTTTYYLRTEAPCGNTNCVSVQIQVANTAPVMTGNTMICQGSSTQLGTQAVYQQYLWSTGETTATITVASPGTYTVTVTNSNGCTVSGAIQVFDIPFTPPQISGNTELCAGDSTSLFAGTGYASYQWSTGAAGSVITVSDSGTYAVTVSNAFGCTGTDSVHVTLHQPPLVSISAQSNLSFCIGDSVLLTASPGLTGWQWYRSQNPIAGATDPQLWIKSAGSYFCIGSDAFECADTSNILTATTRCIIIGSPQDKLNSDQPFYASVLSNPSGEPTLVTVKCPENTQIDFQLYDSLGKLVSVSADIVQTGTYRLSFSGKSGIYILQVRCGNELRNLKLIR